jgi:hypothetical protein
MSAYWIEFDGHKSSCVEADTEQEAKHIASDLTGKTVTACAVIPYPAEPRLNKVEHPQWGITPSFCFKPESCKGHTACPQRYSCTE